MNTKLDQQNIVVGSLLKADVSLHNLTETETILTNLTISLVVCYQRPANMQIEKEHTLIFKALLQDKIILAANEICEVPFEFEIPLYMPMTPAAAIVKSAANISIWQTITDSDELVILPHPKIAELFDTFWELGFKHTALSGYVEKHLLQPLQIFSIRPIKEPYLGVLKDLEFFYDITTEYVEIFIIADKMTKELLGIGKEHNKRKYSKIKFKIMLHETITTKLLSYYIGEILKIVK